MRPPSPIPPLQLTCFKFFRIKELLIILILVLLVCLSHTGHQRRGWWLTNTSHLISRLSIWQLNMTLWVRNPLQSVAKTTKYIETSRKNTPPHMTAHIFRRFPNGKALIIWFSNRNLRFPHLNSVIMSAPVHILQFCDLLRKIKLSSYQPSERSVWENLDRGRQYRPNAVRSVPATEIKILPYRPT